MNKSAPPLPHLTLEKKTRTFICALCAQPVSFNTITSENRVFCCHGCHAVFNILAAKNQLGQFKQNPIFLQALHSGVISNPNLLQHIQDHIQRQQSETSQFERKKIYLEISEMWCPSCAELIKLILLQKKGILNCIVDYTTDLASIEFTPQLIAQESIMQCIRQLGYTPTTLDHLEKKAVSTALYLRFAVAAFCSLNIMMFSYPLYATYFHYDGEGYGNLFAWLSFLTTLPIIFYSAWPIWRRFAASLKTGFFGMETLVAIGVGAASAISIHELLSGGTRVYFDSMSVIIVLVLLGKIIETRAKFSAKESLMRLIRATPRRGRKRFEDGTLRFVPLKEISKGDFLVAYSGEKLVLDGIIYEGEGCCDESLMTGEAIPIAKKKGDGVLGGTILVKGWISYKVVNALEECALSKIIAMLERDMGHKSAYVRAADTIVRWFVPAIILISLLTAACYLIFPAIADPRPFETALLRALAVLLISCPCAIGVAAPAAESYLLNRLAALGAIVRNRGILQFLGRETVIVFDKTGTVTEGRFTLLSDLKKLSKEEKKALHTIASYSTHPISSALAAASFDEKPMSTEKIEEVAGLGIKGIINGANYFLGSARFFDQQGIALPKSSENEEAQVISKVYFAKEQAKAHELILGDRIRQDAKEVLSSLGSLHSVLLSGDAEKPVAAVAKECGFTEWRSCCTPMDKRQFIEQQKRNGKIICMVGDGINDAPALAVANVGISVASATDISIQVSDLILTADRLSILPTIRSTARKGQKIIRQNLFWAFFYNVIGIVLAIFGVLSPIFATIAMSLSSASVLFNAKRIERPWP